MLYIHIRCLKPFNFKTGKAGIPNFYSLSEVQKPDMFIIELPAENGRKKRQDTQRVELGLHSLSSIKDPQTLFKLQFCGYLTPFSA
ncbi:MAG: hypothetical protein C5B54_02810 [Acidobacteria bacterium]|nr:MAG: hypothetical protein C5B54_02810 [Acidobacteriota bacterium]